MAALKSVAARLSLGNPRTLLQSGNLVFASSEDPQALEQRLQAAILEQIGVATEVCVRTGVQWSALIGANPFPEAALQDPSHLLLVAFKTPPRPDGPEAIAAAYKGPERIALALDHAYIVYPEGIGSSKLAPALLGRHLGLGTARNWNTTLKLQAMLAEG
jgi:uncharacterized protein (DUF1697 family)